MVDMAHNDSSRAATLFVSFDLVNATQFKSSNEGAWVDGVSQLMGDIIATFAQKAADGYRFWKVLGDEVVFTKNIPYMYELHDILDDIYHKLVSFNEKYRLSRLDNEPPQGNLAVQATAWIADVSYDGDHADNVYIEYKINENQLQSEYLGTDIDAGFRISQYTSYNRLVISFELAALFLKDRILQRNIDAIHLVGYRSLKGIWNSAPYPIFMYHGNKSHSFRDSIVDVSSGKMKILKEYLEDVDTRITQPGYESYTAQQLTQLCQNETLNHRVETLKAHIQQQATIAHVQSTNGLIVHYSVICYTMDQGQIKILVTKDKDGQMGFGGASMCHNLKYLDTMYLYYLEEFGVELVFEKDKRYNDPIPLVVSNYTVAQQGTPLKGTIFLAKIDSEKFWGELSEHFVAHLCPLDDIEDFQFYDCKLTSKELMVYLRPLIRGAEQRSRGR